MSKDEQKNVYIHPQALVDTGAKIGKDTRIWAFAHVMSGAMLGESCNIGDYAFVESGVKLGNHVTVKNGVQLWEGVCAEDDVFIGPNSVFTNDLVPRNSIPRKKEEWFLPTTLRRGCTIGANATIVCGHTVGRFAFVAAGALVTKNVPDYAMVLGVPARFYAWICECGSKLNFQNEKAKCKKCESVYKISLDKKSISPIDVSPGKQ